MLGKNAEAVSAYRAATKVRPDYFEARTNWEAVNNPGAEHDERLANSGVDQTQPDNPVSHNNLGYAYVSWRGRNAPSNELLLKAIPEYKEALRLSRTTPGAQ